MLKFTTNSADRTVIQSIAERAAAIDVQHNGASRARNVQHHAMNVSACHANGNPLDLTRLLAADDFNFAHDVFGIDRHIDRETGELQNFFSPRFSARVDA
jgi:hypothetical protein